MGQTAVTIEPKAVSNMRVSNMWASSWIAESFFPKPLYLQILDIYSTEQWSLYKVHLCLQSYSVWFPSRAKRTTPPLFRGSALSSSGCGSPPAAPWEWWWLGRRSSSLASLGGSTWLRYQRRRQKETHDEALLSGEHQQVTGWSWAEHPVTTHIRGQSITMGHSLCLFAYH